MPGSPTRSSPCAAPRRPESEIEGAQGPSSSPRSGASASAGAAPRPRHLGRAGVVGGGPARGGSGTRRGRAPRARRGRRRLLRGAPARSSRHAEPAMGFCLLNNVAVTAAALAGRGERVLIVDWDAHHGNGTQDCFYGDPRVLYVSMHEFPLYPGTGAWTRRAPVMARVHRQLPVPGGHDRRRLPGGGRRVGRPPDGSLRADVAARLGRLRRAPRRPAHRPGPRRG